MRRAHPFRFTSTVLCAAIGLLATAPRAQSYRLDVMAQTGGTLTIIDPLASINDRGEVAFTATESGAKRGLVSSTPGSHRTVTTFGGATRFGPGIAINNTVPAWVACRDFTGRNFLMRRWDSSQSRSWVFVGKSPLFVAASSLVDINDSNIVAFSGSINGGRSTALFAGSAEPPRQVATFSGAVQILPQISNTNRIVFRNKVRSIVVWPYPSGSPETIASASGGFTTTGTAPGISRDGTDVGFIGVNGGVEGVYLSTVHRGTRVLLPLFRVAAGAAAFANFDDGMRVGVVKLCANGMDRIVTVAFGGTYRPTASETWTGVFSVDVELIDDKGTLKTSVGSPTVVARAGGMVGGLAITAARIFDAPNANGDLAVHTRLAGNASAVVRAVRAGAVAINAIDVKQKDNEKAHNTEAYKAHFAVRRTQTFDVEIECSTLYSKICHEFVVEATHKFDTTPKTIPVPEVKGTANPARWEYEVKNVDKTAGSHKATLAINVPPTASIGSYTFKAKVQKRGATKADAEKDFPEAVVILFNPWQKTDPVYLAKATERTEYVLAQSGRIWRGSATRSTPKSWAYDQFDKGGITLDVTLDLIKDLKAAERVDAGLVARRLSAQVNSNGGGVLEGNWSGTYTGGKSPSSWTGSFAILKQWKTTSKAVKFGQCWVFGGCLTSTLRVLGIPARPLSNFSSAHDTDANKTIDIYLKANGTRDRARTDDSIWNYHVWCDAWIAGGWNAVDATPQELSDGEFQMGPAPLSAVSGNTGGKYDVDFVYAEVDADVKYFKPDATGKDKLIRTNTTHVGKNITTKKVGGTAKEDITSAYKAAPASGPTVLPSNVSVELLAPAGVPVGSKVDWVVELKNLGSVSRSIQVVMSGASHSYRGDVLGSLTPTTNQTVTIPATGMSRVTLSIPPAELARWLPRSRHFHCQAYLAVQGTTDEFADSASTEVTTGDVPITLTNPKVAQAETVGMSIAFDNPLVVPMTNVRVTFSVGAGLSIDKGTSKTIALGTIGTGAKIIASATALGLEVGVQAISVLIESDQLTELEGEASVEVTPCEGILPYGTNTGTLAGTGSTTPGGELTLSFGNPQTQTAAVFLMMSRAPASVPFPPFGTLLVDVSSAFAVRVGQFPGSGGKVDVTLRIPNIKIGSKAFMQGILFDAGASQQVRLTNGLTITICP